jgi:hypothetical protein
MLTIDGPGLGALGPAGGAGRGAAVLGPALAERRVVATTGPAFEVSLQHLVADHVRLLSTFPSDGAPASGVGIVAPDGRGATFAERDGGAVRLLSFGPAAGTRKALRDVVDEWQRLQRAGDAAVGVRRPPRADRRPGGGHRTPPRRVPARTRAARRQRGARPLAPAKAALVPPNAPRPARRVLSISIVGAVGG